MNRLSGLTVLVVGLAVAGVVSAQGIVPLDLREGWTARAKGPWEMRVDHRELLAMRHGWVASEAGNYAAYSREVQVPESWQGVVSLGFYVSDDYEVVPGEVPSSLTAEGFVGHRRKQVLVNDSVAWSSDVSDRVVKGESPTFRVPLDVAPGETFLLTLLAYDAEASTAVLEDDFYFDPEGKTRESDPNAFGFQTHIYWGDVVLLEGDAAMAAVELPSRRAVREVHAKRWPLPPFGDRWEAYPVRLDISAPTGLPKEGFPLRTGVPVHAGKVDDLSRIRLQTGREGGLAAQKTTIGTWPDDSIQWVLFETTAKPNQETVFLNPARDWAEFSRPVRVNANEDRVTMDSGAVSVEAGIEQPTIQIKTGRRTAISDIELTLATHGTTVNGAATAAETAVEGPYRAGTRLLGRFDTPDSTLGTYELDIEVFAGLPYARIEFLLLNDSEFDLRVSSLRIELTLPEAPETVKVGEYEVGVPAQVEQTSAEERRLVHGAESALINPKSPLFVAWSSAGVRQTVTVKRFRELFPKLVGVNGNIVSIELIAASERPIVFTPGETKTHEIWLAFGDIDGTQFAAAVERPPILQNAEYYCSTGVLGPAAPHEGIPVLHEHMMNGFGDKSWESFGQHFGVRDFPDSPYYGGLPKWSNNYYERMLNLWSEWFLSGDRAWYDLGWDVSRHMLDVAVVHSDVPGKDWLRALHGPGENHVPGPWSPNLRTAGLEVYYRLTGDERARDAFLGVAEFCARTRAGLNSGSVRDHAGPFDALCTAYAETGDPVLLDEGAARVDAAYQIIDLRRGVWPEVHGSYVYRGNVPWMVAQIGRPLYLWYRLSGDVKAAEALVALAESIVCENSDWNEPGAIYGYSHNPHFNMSASYDLLITPIIFAAYELTEDEFFLEAAKAQWERWKAAKQFDSPFNTYWNTPWLVRQLNEYGIEGEPRQ